MRLREAKQLKPGDKVYYRGMETGTEYVGTLVGEWQRNEYEIRTEDGQLILRRYDEIMVNRSGDRGAQDAADGG
jgi:bifunctional DNA-binding transcriptional regulator/antitoxin component of YhaV-PrlF toxin-antitoxin module